MAEIELEEDEVEEKPDIPLYVMATFIALSGVGFLIFTIYYIAFLPIPSQMEPLRIRVLTALQLEKAMEEAGRNRISIIFDQEEKSSIPIYESPDESSEVMSYAPHGATYKRIGSEGGWIKIEHGFDFEEGWIKKEFTIDSIE